jgi:hypothetical protein
MKCRVLTIGFIACISVAGAGCLPGDVSDIGEGEILAENQQSINCTGAAASSSTSSVSVSGGGLTASGQCSWSGGDVNGARLTYYVNNNSVGGGDYSCNQGWQFSTNVGLTTCTTHTFTVEAKPLKLGAGTAEFCSQTIAQSKTFPELSCNKCYIGGIWYGSGAKSPTNGCLKCDPSISKLSWSPNPNGYINTNGYCKPSPGGPPSYCSALSPKVGAVCTTNSDCWLSCSGTNEV